MNKAKKLNSLVIFLTLCFFGTNLALADSSRTYFDQEIKELVKENTPVSCQNLDGNCYGERIPKFKGERAPASFPIVRTKQNLNRYYFLRHCDTPESLAKTIFGDEKYKEKLLSWNKKSKWRTGDVIFFQSPVSNESQLRELYEEHPGRTEQYIVKKGDNLQKIAQTYLGDYRSWKDLAYTNSIRNPDSLKAGQKLTLKYLR